MVQICTPGGRILDPFAGSGTTVLAAVQEGYEAVGIELTDAYFQLVLSVWNRHSKPKSESCYDSLFLNRYINQQRSES